MFFHLVFAGWGFIAPVLLYDMRRKGQFRGRAAVIVGAVSGAACGAGAALGPFQSTSANIHSGYSFAAVGDWLSTAAMGGGRGVGGSPGQAVPVLASSGGRVPRAFGRRRRGVDTVGGTA